MLSFRDRYLIVSSRLDSTFQLPLISWSNAKFSLLQNSNWYYSYFAHQNKNLLRHKKNQLVSRIRPSRLTSIMLSIIVLCCTYISHAQDTSRLRVSILTCGVGEDLYSCYGHSAIRIIDSSTGTDIVYNYGTFNFGDPDFYSKFTRGKLPYYLNDENFQGFIGTYINEGRGVTEQLLDLTDKDAKMVQYFLSDNLKEENKYYRYDFLLDNCSTRVRDIFPTLFNTRFEFGHSMADDSCSFRTILDQYEKNKHWERVGINLLMSHLVDNKMSNVQSMFLPDYLMKGISEATLDGKPIVKETISILPQIVAIPTEVNQPKMLLWAFLFAVVFLSFNKTFQPWLVYVDVLLFMLLGLLGCFMLFMWFGTEHAVCSYNRNLFWAFPLHLIFAFMLTRNSDKASRYARYASWLVTLSMLYGLIATQAYMSEIIPLLLLILFRLGKYARRSTYFAFNKQV